MRLFVHRCGNCGQKIVLNVNAGSRSQLRSVIGGNRFRLRCGACGIENHYSVDDVFAESGSNSALTGGTVGGIVGLIGGPIGAIVGSAVGATIGMLTEQEEARRIKFFNHSR